MKKLMCREVLIAIAFLAIALCGRFLMLSNTATSYHTAFSLAQDSSVHKCTGVQTRVWRYDGHLNSRMIESLGRIMRGGSAGSERMRPKIEQQRQLRQVAVELMDIFGG